MNPKETPNYNEFSDEGIITDDNKGKDRYRILIRCIVYLILVVTCIIVFPRFVIHRSIVNGISMEPTLYKDEHILVEKISKAANRLKRYDVIVFYPYGKDSDEYFIKRIIGLPGETIWISEGVIYINNSPLNETFGSSDMTYEGIVDEPYYINEDEYFVMGDNRIDSFDSRYEQIGAIKRENIIGRAIFVIWPFKNFGTIE